MLIVTPRTHRTAIALVAVAVIGKRSPIRLVPMRLGIQGNDGLDLARGAPRGTFGHLGLLRCYIGSGKEKGASRYREAPVRGETGRARFAETRRNDSGEDGFPFLAGKHRRTPP
ncbi:hypothetical protein PHAMO_30094 [Magnetospirillum molischianum DSM 120]|uniref:Uncharacterized protein n=1 Tax=Magnetospirillum molischianum DSM 120 TaxID=1150626 RepID=H8FUA0_MAGML|nr:hypothetical protein PHAMO_30094 [Magnetospirillum molischianum DSM 120]